MKTRHREANRLDSNPLTQLLTLYFHSMNKNKDEMCIKKLRTIQNSVSLAKFVYWSIVDNTLNIRHISTIMKLQEKQPGFKKNHRH